MRFPLEGPEAELLQNKVTEIEHLMNDVKRQRKLPALDREYNTETDEKQLGVIISLDRIIGLMKQSLQNNDYPGWRKKFTEYRDGLIRESKTRYRGSLLGEPRPSYIRALRLQDAEVIKLIDALLAGEEYTPAIKIIKPVTYTTRSGVKAVVERSKYGDESGELIFIGMIYKDPAGFYGQWDVNGFDRAKAEEYDLIKEGFDA